MLSKSGIPLPAPYSFSFTIAPFKVTNTSPRDGSTHVSRNEIYIQMSDFIDTSSIRRSFSISPSTTGTFDFPEPTSYFFFYPDSLQPLTVYSVTISDSLHAADGTPLAVPYRFSFATGE
jgi:hypothetical protein